MSSAREIAMEVLPHLAEAVLSRRVLTYGYYAKAIGRSPQKDAIAIGQAMHTIGGVCVYGRIPVAPLFFVKRSDGEWRGIFEGDPLEASLVLPHYDTLYVSAREHKYTEDDFRRILRGLAEVVPKDWPPHFVWHYAVVNKPKCSDETYFQRALKCYISIVENARVERKKVQQQQRRSSKVQEIDRLE